jgi:hypothetical protein
MDFPHRDLIVLEYDDVEDLPRFKHIDSRREKEKASSNRNTREAVKETLQCLHYWPCLLISVLQPILIGMFVAVLMVPTDFYQMIALKYIISEQRESSVFIPWPMLYRSNRRVRDTFHLASTLYQVCSSRLVWFDPTVQRWNNQ